MKRKLLSVLLTFCLAFSLLPTAALADEGKVANVGDAEYTTLQAAVDAANANDTVKLLANVTEDVTINKSITLDLGGKTLTNTNAGKATLTVAAGATATVMNGNIVGGTSFYTIQNNGTATLKDVTAKAGNTGSSMIDNWGTLTINSGDYSGGLNVVKSEEDSKLTIDGGKFTLDYATNGYTGVIFAYGDTTITGGEFIQSLTSTGRWNHPQVVATGVVEGYPAITKITGGTFTNNISGEGIFRGVGKGTSDNFEVSGGTFNKSISDGYCADGFIPTKNADGTYGVKEGKYVAAVGSKNYETLADAIRLAAKGKTVKLLADTRENVTIDKAMTLDLNGHTLNGGTVKATPALTITARTVTIKDSSAAQTGTIMREDTAGNSGVSSHYVIDIQDNAWVIFKSGKVTNNSGNIKGKGASLVRIGDDSVANKQPGLVINGGTFTQDNFIVIKVDRGYLTLNDGTLTSANSYAVENWFNATIKGGTVNGAVSSWTYSDGTNSFLTINGGTVTGDVTSVNYGNAEGKKATVTIKGGTFTGKLDTRSYDLDTGELTSIVDAAKATIKVSGGTFDNAVEARYCDEGYTPVQNSDGKYGVQQQVLAKIGDTAYYTMDEAFHAVLKDETIVMQRDYTTGAEQYSGNKSFAIDLNGKTWTYTGTNTNHAAFEINYPNVTLTVKNGKIFSSQLVGLIPSAMGGTITYDNSSLVFENVQMSTTATSGIETNGNNTDDSVMLKNSTLNVPTGFGIYFPSSGTLTIDNSTINAKTMGVQVCAGSLSINAGSAITVSGDAVPKIENDGAIQDGAAISIVNRTGYKGLGNITVTGGMFKANGNNAAIKAYDWANKTESDFTADKGTVAVSGGYFTSDPSAYLAASHYVWASDKDGYAYMVKDTAPTSAGQKIIVIDKTEATVNGSISTDDKSKIEAVKNKTNVDGVAEAVAAKKADLIPESVDTSTATKVEVEVSVKVEVKSADLSGENAAKTLTFEAKPVATIKVDGAVKATDVPVPNSLLSGEITVKLPLPEGFTPKQIKHTSSDGSVEYFLDTQKTGAKTFEIKDGCAVFTITKFSTFELSGTVTYDEPSYSSGSSSDPTYSVSTPSKTEHGTVTVSPKSASKGDTVTVTVKPDSGYVLETLTVTDKNGNELTLKDKGNGKYTFTMPTGKVEVKATFMEDNSMLNFFYDVPNNAYFYEAVKWAVENGITTGVGNDLFAPEQPCTRAQIVTFLWRAAGSPEPKGTAAGMTDVVSGSYYEKAVAWAIENGITTGTTTSTFSPDATCTRAQAVTFLARALNAKAASAAEFSDVPTDSYFADAVAWAAANGVTEGIGGGLFGSDNDCTRGQIVTFLYRAYNK